MGLRRALVLAAAGTLLWAGTAQAAPENGFGAYVGFAAHDYFDDSSRYSYGTGVAGDMQFVINDRWSLLPFLALSVETVRDGFAETDVNGSAGFQVRRWSGDEFVGAHVAAYSNFRDKQGNLYGPGVGVTVGKERADGLIYAAQVELPRSWLLLAGPPFLLVNPTAIAVQLQVGYRWR